MLQKNFEAMAEFYDLAHDTATACMKFRQSLADMRMRSPKGHAEAEEKGGKLLHVLETLAGSVQR